jgi:hypothetical protein
MQPHSHTRSSSRALLAVRVCGALLVLFVGADHLYEYSHDDYSVLPTIGTLFLLNFISATLVGALLLAPVKRLFGRFGARVLEVAALSGFGITVTSLAALLYSEQAPLFGFMESNYRPRSSSRLPRRPPRRFSWGGCSSSSAANGGGWEVRRTSAAISRAPSHGRREPSDRGAARLRRVVARSALARRTRSG